jgi:serine/threonine protein kinase
MDTIRVFISYRHDDSRHQVGRLYDRLVARFGASQVFRDVDSIPLGLDFRELMTERAVTCDVFLAVIGDAWVSVVGASGKRRLDDPDDYVRIEIEAALRREIPVIPVLVSSAPVPTPAELPESLRQLSFRNAAPIRPDPDFHTDMDRLIVGIERAVVEARRRSDPNDTENHGPEAIPTFDEMLRTDPRIDRSSVAGPPFDAPLAIPERFGRYRILRRLGEMTRGSVFLAVDPQLQRQVALKVPDLGLGRQTEVRLRFLAEARAMATLSHPQLCPVLESGEVDGRPYLTMAYIDGKSLARTMLPGGLPPRQVAVLVGKLALAMREVHLKGIIHRNLKPANIVFPEARQRHDSVIVDFGHVQREIARDTRWGEFKPPGGTLGYLAPEQVRGDPHVVGAACDIFALGVILYELLVGRLPARQPGWAETGRGPAVGSPSLSAHADRLDPALREICWRAMATEVADRYRTMGELAAALAGFLRSPSAAPPRTELRSGPSSP